MRHRSPRFELVHLGCLASALLAGCLHDPLTEERPAPDAAAASRDAGVSADPRPLPALIVQPPRIIFEDTVVGASNLLFLVVRNPAQADQAYAVTVQGDDARHFELGKSYCRGVVRGKGDCLLELSFSPRSAGVHEGTLVITTDRTIEAPLSGRALPPAELRVEPRSIDVGDIPAGTIVNRDIVVTNVGEGASGPGMLQRRSYVPEWSVTRTSCFEPLPPGGSCSASLTFVSHVPGTFVATIDVLGFGPTGGTSAIELRARVP